VGESFDHVTYSSVMPDDRQQRGAPRRLEEKRVGDARATTRQSVGQ
jgi:hypothetical protein